MNDNPDFTREPIGRFEWERLIRRAILKPSSVKLLGLVMATYASADGTRVRPGQRRLANVMGTSVSTVERGQRALESYGFVEMTYKGHSAGRGRSGGYASEYRLTVPSDLLERIPMLDPEENHPAPMTGDSQIQPAPVTGKYPPEGSRDSREPQCSEDVRANARLDIPVIPEETPVTGAETPVILTESPSTHDVPPDHYHHIKDQPKNINQAVSSPSVTHASGSPIEDERNRQLNALAELIEREKQAS
ncbi:hypothetical protein [Paenarthrobacter sp. YIM B13468]|uniref:hypothetical protein n=1 Tax=Paenarthrobacter sp. YIM B13468 TaxID=3366295 RepID=UPI00366E738B